MFIQSRITAFTLSLIHIYPRYMIHELQASGKELDARLAFVITCSGVLDPLARYRMAEESSNMAIVLCHRAYFGDEKTMEESRCV